MCFVLNRYPLTQQLQHHVLQTFQHGDLVRGFSVHNHRVIIDLVNDLFAEFFVLTFRNLLDQRVVRIQFQDLLRCGILLLHGFVDALVFLGNRSFRLNKAGG